MHAGAVIVPAVLAACERHNPDGPSALAWHRGRGRDDLPAQPGGAEGACTRRASIRPRCSAPWRRRPASAPRSSSIGGSWSTRSASSARWRAASSSISPRVPGPSGCIPAGRRNRACARRCSARAGFVGPRTVFEGVHGLFHGFAHTSKGDYDALTGDFGDRWVTETLAFKSYPCGTMTHPYIDCARRLGGARHQGGRDQEIVCEVGEGTVHRLWEPLAAKQRAAQRLCRKVLDALLYRRRLRARQCRARRLHRRRGARPATCSRSPPRCATKSIRKIPIRQTSPATSGPCSPTAAWSRSASRICAAARTSRSPARDIEEKFVLNAEPWRMGQGAGATGTRPAADAL